MRIIAGEFKSRILKDPKSKRTHPMSEKIRGAMFNSLGDISGKTFLDAFAGTGSVAVEALSRGAVGVHAVEINPDSFDILKANRDAVTDSSRLRVHRSNVKSWVNNNAEFFDIIMADPPYDAVSMNTLEAVSEFVQVGGLLIVSLPIAEHFRKADLKLLEEKRYGNAKLAFYKKLK